MGIEIECAAVVVEEGEEGVLGEAIELESEIVEEIIEEEAEDAGALVESWSRVVAGGDSKYSQCMSEIVDGCESVKAVCVIMRW